MATSTDRLHLSITSSGAKQVTRNLKGMQVAMLAVGYAAIRMGSSLRESTDNITNLKNQTKVFAKSQEGANYRMEESIRIARKWNKPLKDVGEVMQRVSIAQDAAGIGDETVVKVVENLTAAVSLSGATAQEASGALRQFAQGMAANRLSGQELNSVLAQTPLVASILADTMNDMGKWGRVAIGDLRRLGETGQITTQVLVETFGKEIPKLEELFKKYEFPIEALFKSLGNEWDIFVNQFGEATGATNWFKDTLKDIKIWGVKVNQALADGTLNISKYTKAAMGMVKVYGFLKIASLAWATSIGVIRLAITGTKGLITAFTSFRTLMIRMMPLMGAFAAPLLAIAGIGIAIAVGMKAAGKGFKDFERMGVNAVVALSNKWNDMLAVFQTIKDYMGGKVGFGDWTETFERNRSGLSSISAETLLDSDGSLGGAVGDYLSAKFEEGMGVLKNNLPAMGEGLMSFFGAADDFIMPGVTGDVSTDGDTFLAKKGKPDKAPSGVKYGKMTADEMSKYETLLDKLHPLIKATEQYHDAVDLLNKKFSMDGAEGAQSFADNMTLVEASLGRTTQMMEALAALGTQESFLFNFGSAMQQNFADAANAAQTFGNIAANAFDSALDGLVEFTMTGKFDIKSFAKTMIGELQKVIMKLIMIKMLEKMTGLGGGIGGFATSALNVISPRATGGPVTSGKPFLVGEKGPELFVPPSGGSIKNAAATAGMAQTAPQVTIVNSDDPASIPAAMNTDAGAEVILNVIQRNPEILRPLG